MRTRRVWWVGVALAVAVALLAGFAFLANYNSTDARIERAVAQIVDEYGFELSGQTSGIVDPSQMVFASSLYTRAPMDAQTADEIVAMLREACPSCEYKNIVRDEDGSLVATSGGEAWTEAHRFFPTGQHRRSTTAVLFVPDDKGGGMPGKEPDAFLLMNNFDRPSLWHRIKGLWPW